MLILPSDFVPVRQGGVTAPDGRTLAWAEFGDPDGDPVIWFHGSPGGRRQLPPDGPGAAARRGMRLIGIDRPGTGASTAHQYGRVVDMAADVEAVADALGLERFAVAGLSGGGPFTLACCWAMPDRVTAGAVLGGVGPTVGVERAPGIPRLLVPLEPVLRLLARPLGTALTVAARAARPFMEQGFELYVAVGPKADREVLRAADLKAVLLNDLSTSLDDGLLAPMYDLVVFGRDWGFSLQEITQPVTFWHGDADGIVPFGHGPHQAGLVPNAKLVVCPGGGHFAGYGLVEDVLDSLR